MVNARTSVSRVSPAGLDYPSTGDNALEHLPRAESLIKKTKFGWNSRVFWRFPFPLVSAALRPLDRWILFMQDKSILTRGEEKKQARERDRETS